MPFRTHTDCKQIGCWNPNQLIYPVPRILWPCHLINRTTQKQHSQSVFHDKRISHRIRRKEIEFIIEELSHSRPPPPLTSSISLSHCLRFLYSWIISPNAGVRDIFTDSCQVLYSTTRISISFHFYFQRSSKGGAVLIKGLLRPYPGELKRWVGREED